MSLYSKNTKCVKDSKKTLIFNGIFWGTPTGKHQWNFANQPVAFHVLLQRPAKLQRPASVCGGRSLHSNLKLWGFLLALAIMSTLTALYPWRCLGWNIEWKPEEGRHGCLQLLPHPGGSMEKLRCWIDTGDSPTKVFPSWKQHDEGPQAPSLQDRWRTCCLGTAVD